MIERVLRRLIEKADRRLFEAMREQQRIDAMLDTRQFAADFRSGFTNKATASSVTYESFRETVFAALPKRQTVSQES